MKLPNALRILIGVSFAFILAADAFPAETVKTDQQRLIYMGTTGPVFMTLDISIGGKSLTEFRRDFVLKQFKGFDEDYTAVLESNEASRLPAFGKGEAGERTLGDKWTILDIDPKDDKLSFNEVVTHYETMMGPEFSLTRRVKDEHLEVDLVQKLDSTGDRSVSADELRAGHRKLIQLDLDDDETISAAELAPLSDPTNRPSFVTEAEDSQQAYPFVLLKAQADFKAIVEQIIQQYDIPEDGEADGSLSRGEIPGTFDQLASADSDADGLLQPKELSALLSTPREDLHVQVQMPTRRRAKITQPKFGDRTIEFRVKRHAFSGRDTVSFFKIQFLQMDRDKNRYLDEQEFGGLQLAGATFSMVDLDGDGQLMLDELGDYMNQLAALSRCRVIMRVDLNRTSLFEILDADGDQRLSRGEFLSGRDRVRKYDLDRDGLMEQSEFESKYAVTVELSRPGLIPNSDGIMRRTQTGAPRLETSVTGPVWFQRMDVNRDGDVSLREFLGPVEHFRKFDRNENGILETTEVEAG